MILYDSESVYLMNSEDNIITLRTQKVNLLNALQPYLADTARTWLQQAQEAIAASAQVKEDLGLYSAMAKRKLGTASLDQTDAIDTTFSPLNIRRWSCTDAARLTLLMTAIESIPEKIQNIITAYYKMGDESEKIAFIRGLIYFAPADYLIELALDAGRTNNLELLAALTLDNPFPACFYSDQAFNQMVLKGLFLGLAIERVEGIEQRANADLTRMCENYVVEREEAGRTVPVDIWLAIGPYASATGRQQMVEYLKDDNVGHRYYCALALAQRLSKDTTLEPILRDHIQNETEPMITKLLQDTLQVGSGS